MIEADDPDAREWHTRQAIAQGAPAHCGWAAAGGLRRRIESASPTSWWLRRGVPAGRREVAQVAGAGAAGQDGRRGRVGVRRGGAVLRAGRDRCRGDGAPAPRRPAAAGALPAAARGGRLGVDGPGAQRRRHLRVGGRRRLVRPRCAGLGCAGARRRGSGRPAGSARWSATTSSSRIAAAGGAWRRRRIWTISRWRCWPSRSCARSATMCRWREWCGPQLEAVADLSLVSGVGVARRRLYIDARRRRPPRRWRALDWTTAELVRRGVDLTDLTDRVRDVCRSGPTPLASMIPKRKKQLEDLAALGFVTAGDLAGWTGGRSCCARLVASSVAGQIELARARVGASPAYRRRDCRLGRGAAGRHRGRRGHGEHQRRLLPLGRAGDRPPRAG